MFGPSVLDSACPIKILLASRPAQQIKECLIPCYQVVLGKENEGGISRAVDTQLQFLIHEGDRSIFEDISSCLKKNARAVFLWT